MQSLQNEIEEIFKENLTRVGAFITNEIIDDVVECTLSKLENIEVDYAEIKSKVKEEIRRNLTNVD